MDEWLQKWNRTCPLCKSTIQRRKGGRGAGGGNQPLGAGSSSSDQERARLLSHENERESETSGGGGGGGGGRGEDIETYGATGHLESPLTRRAHSDEGERGRIDTVTLETHEEGVGRRSQSNLEEVVVRGGGGETSDTTRLLEEQG